MAQAILMSASRPKPVLWQFPLQINTTTQIGGPNNPQVSAAQSYHFPTAAERVLRNAEEPAHPKNTTIIASTRDHCSRQPRLPHGSFQRSRAVSLVSCHEFSQPRISWYIAASDHIKVGLKCQHQHQYHDRCQYQYQHQCQHQCQYQHQRQHQHQ